MPRIVKPAAERRAEIIACAVALFFEKGYEATTIVDILERTIAGKTINGRSCRVKVYPTPEHIDHCEILFLPRSEARQTQAAIAAVGGKPILTVSELEHFSSDGGMIEFVLIDDTVKFDINLGAVERSGLKIGSELLRVARGIKGRQR